MSESPLAPEEQLPPPLPSGSSEPSSPAATEPEVAPSAPEAGDSPLLTLALQELSARRQSILEEIAELEQRREQLHKEITASFSGQSDAIARRMRGFQDYLVGALQDLAAAAEQVDLVPQPVLVQPSPLDLPQPEVAGTEPAPAVAARAHASRPRAAQARARTRRRAPVRGYERFDW